MSVPDPLFVYLVGGLGVTEGGLTIVVMPSRRRISGSDENLVKKGAPLNKAFESSPLGNSERIRFVGALGSLPGVGAVYNDNRTHIGAYWVYVDVTPSSLEEWAKLESVVATQMSVTFGVEVIVLHII